MRRNRRYNNRRKSRRVAYSKYRHVVKPMKGLTSIPVSFRGRRVI